MTRTELESMSLRQLEQLKAECLRGSDRDDQVTPVLESKRRRAESRRTWIIAIVASAIALIGLLLR